MYVAPHAKTFLNALSKCGESYSLTQIDQHRLSIKSGPFKANIPCIDPTLLYFPTPNQMQGSMTDDFKSALSLVEKIKPENGQRLITLSFLMNGNSIISTDGKIIIEAWHGLNLPTNLPIPKAVIPLINGSKKLVGFGFDNLTATFFFEDNSFIRTQLYADKWPDILNILDRPFTPLPIPENLFNGVEAIQEFSHNGFIHFKDGKLLSEDIEEKGASFDIEGLRGGPVYSAKYLMMLKEVMEKADFHVPAERKGHLCYFTGKNVRGILMGYG
ncbi:MAG TPA: hypothetical protein VKZ95_00795 [Sphingobacteriaceae bacterium]|nr:hypothetical protein [Sphingobacteriaceae bacterium]